MHKVLFICTGNYYRSRYAELYFNALAEKQNLDWRAFSRGLLVAELGSQNVGPIYPRALIRLKEHEIPVEDKLGFPIQLNRIDLQEADLVIALNEPEHQPLMQQRFPEWTNRITYWYVPDLDQVGSEVALPRIEQYVTEQLQYLKHPN